MWLYLCLPLSKWKVTPISPECAHTITKMWAQRHVQQKKEYNQFLDILSPYEEGKRFVGLVRNRDVRAIALVCDGKVRCIASDVSDDEACVAFVRLFPTLRYDQPQWELEAIYHSTQEDGQE